VIAVGIGLVVVAILISLLGAIWVGVPLVIAGLVLVAAALLGIGRRAADTEPPAA
jgi:hypothetical protein